MAAVDRQFLYNALKTLNYPVKFIGQSYRYETSPYLVLRNSGMNTSANRTGAYDMWEVLVYVPDTSVKFLDGILDKVEETLVLADSGIEATGQRGSDYHDTEINMIMNYIEFRVPRLIRGCIA